MASVHLEFGASLLSILSRTLLLSAIAHVIESTFAWTLQPLRIQMKPDVVETAIMHIMEADANTSEMRLAAMHQINPLHTFMFNSRGKLLNANAAAIAACEIPGTGCSPCHGVSLNFSTLPVLIDCSMCCGCRCAYTYTWPAICRHLSPAQIWGYPARICLLQFKEQL